MVEICDTCGEKLRQAHKVIWDGYTPFIFYGNKECGCSVEYGNMPVYATTATTSGYSVELRESWLGKYYREMNERLRRGDENK